MKFRICFLVKCHFLILMSSLQHWSIHSYGVEAARIFLPLRRIAGPALMSANLFFSDPALSATTPEALSDQDNRLVQMAFRDFDDRRFDASEKEFSIALKTWKRLNRPRDEIVSLLIARGNVLLDNKKFADAEADFSEAIGLMKVDGEKEDGTGRYPEYVSAFVDRGLAHEGLAEWKEALSDYDKAIELWGGGRGDNVNPFVLTYRGNVLTRLNRYADAILDFEASSNLFLQNRDIARFTDARANYALALYQEGKIESALKAMNDVIRKNQGSADMRVAIAAHKWGTGDYLGSLKDFRFVCDNIDVGCDLYKDINWVRTVRRWPESLIRSLEYLINREIPPDLLKSPEGGAGGRMAST